ncbi:MAG: flagellar biosynthesis protein FlhB [Bdellovibrionales bacterium]
MAEEAGSEEKTEEATAQRREDFRKRGQVAQSKELASVLMLGGSSLAIWALGRFFLEQLIELQTVTIGEYLQAVVRSGDTTAAIEFCLTKGSFILGPILMICMILGFMSSVLQVGFIYNEDALEFDLNRINPIEGFKRLLTLRSLVEGFKAFLKVCLVVAVAYFIIQRDIISSPLLVQFNAQQIFIFMSEIVLKLLLGVGLVMLVLSVLDYGYQWWDLEQKMMMTKQEVKEEHKSREGDPLIRARIRKIQRDLATKRMMSDVPKADVIVTNPTHIAVALQYSDAMPAPKILAIGADIVAERIKEIARENNIPLVENKPLARAIFKTLKVGQFIPRELFHAVAEVLAYVYKLKRRVLR